MAFVFVALSTFVARAQNTNLLITGTIVDSNDGSPLPYASAVAKAVADNKIINGTATDLEGSFQLTSNSADIFIEFSFII